VEDIDAQLAMLLGRPVKGFKSSVKRPGWAPPPERADVYDHKTDTFITQSEWDRRYPRK
jgi:hypothetical protein